MSELLVRVRQRLDEAGLKVARDLLESHLDEALREGKDPLQFLDELLDKELVVRKENRIERRLKDSRLPKPFKTLECFDWDFQPKLDRGRILALSRLDFLREHLNILITGRSGTGKSHIAKALAFLACGADVRVLYTSCTEMLNTLYAALADHSLDRKLRRYQRAELLVIDDLGTEKVEILHGQGASLFFKVINYRYGKASTILTSNLATSKWDEYFGDPNVTVAALDRLTHHAIPVTIAGASWRADQMKKRMETEEKTEETVKGSKRAPAKKPPGKPATNKKKGRRT